MLRLASRRFLLVSACALLLALTLAPRQVSEWNIHATAREMTLWAGADSYAMLFALLCNTGGRFVSLE